ncbi:unnamed protein product, partial [Bubo scandiacus]
PHLQTCTEMNARHPLDESNSEYTDPCPEETGKKRSCPMEEIKAKRYFIALL